jgi:hypothetical protein
VSFMLSVVTRTTLQNIVVLSVVMLNVVMLSVVAPSSLVLVEQLCHQLPYNQVLKINIIVLYTAQL